MARSNRGLSAKDYKSVGTTNDGVRILASKRKATSFTTAEIRAAVAGVFAGREPRAPNSDSKPKSRSGKRSSPAK